MSEEGSASAVVQELFEDEETAAVDVLLSDREEGELLDSIVQESLPVERGPVLKNKVNTVLQTFMGSNKVLKGTSEKFKNVLVPENSEFLEQTRVNDSIYQLLSHQSKRDNSEFLKVESALCKSAIIQARLMENLLELKKAMPASQTSIVHDMVKQMATSIEIQGFGRTKLNDLRREKIVKSLNPEFKGVISATSPGEGLLFGNDLSDTLKDIDNTNKMAARLSKPVNNGSAAFRTSTQKNHDDSFLERGQASPTRKRGWRVNNNRFRRTYGGRGRREHHTNRRRSPSPKGDYRKR